MTLTIDEVRAAFALDPAVLHWNHGSYGACPRAALAAQAAVRAELESATKHLAAEVAQHSAPDSAVAVALRLWALAAA